MIAMTTDPNSDTNPTEPEVEANPVLTWREFVFAVARLDGPDSLKTALLHIYTMAEGQEGYVVNTEELAGLAGRKRSTVTNHIAALAAEGWLTRTAQIASAGRAVVVYATARSIKQDG